MSSGGLQHELDTIPFRNIPLNAHNTKWNPRKIIFYVHQLSREVEDMPSALEAQCGLLRHCGSGQATHGVGFYGIMGLAGRRCGLLRNCGSGRVTHGVGFYGIVGLDGWHTVWASMALWVWSGDTRCGLLRNCGSGRATPGVGFYGIVGVGQVCTQTAVIPSPVTVPWCRQPGMLAHPLGNACIHNHLKSQSSTVDYDHHDAWASNCISPCLEVIPTLSWEP